MPPTGTAAGVGLADDPHLSPMIRSPHFVLTVVAAGALLEALGACAHAPVPPTPKTVFTTVDRMLTGPAHLVFVENRSSVPVTVYRFTLRDCKNVKGPCAVRPLDLRVAPGARVQMARVDPSDRDKPFTYHYAFDWRTDSAAVTVVTLGPVELASAASEAGSLRPEPDSLVIRVGDRVPIDTIRVYLTGARNEIVGRVRMLEWQLPSGAAALAPPDSVIGRTPGRSSLQLKLPDDVLPDRAALHAPIQVPIVVRP